jgi:hypothetical protein
VEGPEWDLQKIGQLYFFYQDQPEMVENKNHPGEIKKNNPEKELTEK